MDALLLGFSTRPLWWALTWPAWLAQVALLYVLYAVDSSLLQTQQGEYSVAVSACAIYYAVQAVRLPLLVRKEFRSFYIVVVRGETVGRRLGLGESVQVSLWFFVGRTLVAALVAAFPLLPNVHGSPVGVIWFLWLMNFGFSDVVFRKYRGFRLQVIRREQSTPSPERAPVEPATPGSVTSRRLGQ